MHCSACAARIERALGRLPGVASASVNLATARAFVSYDGSAISAGELCQAVADVGYTAKTGRRRRWIRSPSAQRPMGAACDHLLAAGDRRVARVAPPSPDRGSGMDRPRPRRRRRARRRLAVPPQHRSPSAPWRSEHGHPDRLRHARRGRRAGRRSHCRRGQPYPHRQRQRRVRGDDCTTPWRRSSSPYWSADAPPRPAHAAAPQAPCTRCFRCARPWPGWSPILTASAATSSRPKACRWGRWCGCGQMRRFRSTGPS